MVFFFSDPQKQQPQFGQPRKHNLGYLRMYKPNCQLHSMQHGLDQGISHMRSWSLSTRLSELSTRPALLVLWSICATPLHIGAKRSFLAHLSLSLSALARPGLPPALHCALVLRGFLPRGTELNAWLPMHGILH